MGTPRALQQGEGVVVPRLRVKKASKFLRDSPFGTVGFQRMASRTLQRVLRTGGRSDGVRVLGYGVGLQPPTADYASVANCAIPLHGPQPAHPQSPEWHEAKSKPTTQ